MKKRYFLAAGIMAAVLLTGCASEKQKEAAEVKTEAEVQMEEAAEVKTEAEVQTEEAAETKKETETQTEETAEVKTEAEESGSVGTDEKGSTAAEGLFGAFESKDLNGGTVTQEIFTEADLNMVNIWGTFCGPCIREMPDLGELAEEYADKGVQLVGIVSDTVDPDNEEAHLIVEETGADYTHIVVSESLYYNYMMQVQVVPTTVFVDSEGKQVGDVYTGARSKDDWAAIVDELLAEIGK